ncbi:transposase [Streptomyces sp. B3I8]|nr:transposase [Streptomyces sp. B3I8]
MPYATDLSDEQWALTEPLVAAWKQERVARSATGAAGSCDLREVVNTLLHQNRTGCQWRLRPHGLTAWSAVFHYFTLWRQGGLDQRIQEILRCQAREWARRSEDPSLVIIDTQSVRVAAGVPKTTTGLDANKKTPGRKRGLAVDVLGPISHSGQTRIPDRRRPLRRRPAHGNRRRLHAVLQLAPLMTTVIDGKAMARQVRSWAADQPSPPNLAVSPGWLSLVWWRSTDDFGRRPVGGYGEGPTLASMTTA